MPQIQKKYHSANFLLAQLKAINTDHVNKFGPQYTLQ